MKNKLSIFILSLITAVLFTACGDDDSTFNGPFRLNIAGPSEVRPESTEEYTIGDFTNPGSYTWTVSGPATIEGSASGNTISVKFGDVGDVVITVTNGTDNGTFTVTVAETEPAVSVSYNGTGVLRNGEADTVFFEFDAPIQGIPSFAMNTTDSTQFNAGNPFVSGTLGSLVEVDADSYYAIYTAGTGNGTPEALFQDIKSTATFGEVNIDSAFVKLYRVDNIAPGADLSYSSVLANDSTVVTITVTFSEEVVAADPATDSSLLVTFSNAGVAVQTDTLEATDDPLVYTVDYIVNGGGNGYVEVLVHNVADLAGNTSEIYSYDLVVDNIAPILNYGSDGEEGYATIYVWFGTGPNYDAGTTYYAVFPDGADAPTSVEDFENAVATGSKEVETGGFSTYTVGLTPGEYDVYYVGKDRAGNWTPIASENLTVL